MAKKSLIDKVPQLLAQAVIIGGLAGVASMFLGGFLSSLMSNALMSGIMTIVIALVVAWLFAEVGKDAPDTIGELVLLLAMVSGVTSIISSFMPQLTQYMLSVGELTISGLLFTFLYVGIAMYVKKKLGL